MVDDVFLQAWKDKERELWLNYADAVVQRLDPELILATQTTKLQTTRS